MRTSLAFAVAFCGMYLISGCGKDEPQIDPASPQSYMHDKQFMQRLEDQEKAKRNLMVEFSKVNAEYKAAKAKDPEGEATKALKARVDALEKEYVRLRTETQAIVRERITPKNLKK